MKNKYKQIVIIGFRGAGKSTVGRLLAQQLNWTYVSTDDMVEKRAQKTIADIVAESGWKKFRELEHEIIQSVSELIDSVIDCGGGIVEDNSNMNYFKSDRLIIWIDAELNDIKSRISENQNMRPLLTQSDLHSDVEQNYAKRLPLYEKFANLRFSSSINTPQEICHTIRKKLTPGNQFSKIE
jgi:shikimate kinase